jgi:type II secretory ATPase GspE/PulE/Tfp pilus assembly ATPase PilB-like protein
MIKILKNKKTAAKPIQEETSDDEKTRKIISGFRKREEEEIAAALAAELDLPYVDTNLIPIATEDIKLISQEDSEKFQTVVLRKMGKSVSLASSSPTSEKTRQFIVNLGKEKDWQIKLFVISRSNLRKIQERYKNIVFVDILDQMSLSLSGAELESFEVEMKDLVMLKQKIKDLPVTQILNIMLAGAYKLKASDVHIEPQEKEIRLRYRIDGILQDIAFLPLNTFKSILSRIKLMAGMKINVRDTAQDGTFEIKLGLPTGEKKIDTRVSIIPGNFGESVVIRILDPDAVKVSVESLGLQGLAYEILQKQILSPNGMILNTGPTGSGKTTTLYAILNKLNTPDKKIITIEDPIEYELKGISQTQVEKDRGYTFDQGLRSIVRQDPDIILVGEIRDSETADIAINSALTGHLVLSSLHTNNAMGAIPRLLELGIKPSLMPSSINAIIGQRLVRKLCDCKEAYVPAKESIESIQKVLSIISPRAKVEIPKNITKLYRPKGCPKCNGLGYKGRLGIFEVLTINQEIEKLILEMAGETELAVAAMESGMITMLQDGILKAVAGITSIDEVKQVTGQGEFLEQIYEKLMSQTLGRSILIKKENFEAAEKNIGDFKKFQKIISATKTTDLAKVIFSAAAILKTGDIHIEPGPEEIQIRFRIDGILQTAAHISKNEYPAFLGEIKLLSGVKTEVRQGVIDSRFNIKFDDDIKKIKEENIDVRVSIILGGYGETVVLRLLSKENLNYDLTKLGIRKENLEKIKEEIQKPNGIILNTGPTGSGKTTTLYSILQQLNKPEIKIITVEDPIEYQIPGILQTPVNEKEGYTFATALRQLLRQNPDILMIGEIRDNETAAAATQAALTGHLVLSTIHTNSAAGAVSRMENMDVSPQDIASAVNAFIAQRLVRKLCDCKEKSVPNEEEKKKIEKVLKTISLASGIKIPKIENIYRPKGCIKCNNLGYKGRMTISEVFQMKKEIKELIVRNAITSELEEKAVELGMLTIIQDGILRVLEGETTLEEIERVTDL